MQKMKLRRTLHLDDFSRDLKIPGRDILGRGIMAEETWGEFTGRKAPKLNLRNARTRSRTDQCRIIVYNFLTT